MIYGYARVSTLGQAKDGNSIEAQEKMLLENGAEMIFADAFTGTKNSRPQFNILLSRLNPGDTLVVTKLDRIARSTQQGCQLVRELLDRDIRINVLNLGIMDNTPTGKLIRTILFAFAEFERDMIVERTMEGKAIARERGNYREGRPKKPVENFEKVLEKRKTGEISVKSACQELNISKTQWYRLCKQTAQAYII